MRQPLNPAWYSVLVGILLFLPACGGSGSSGADGMGRDAKCLIASSAIGDCQI